MTTLTLGCFQSYHFRFSSDCIKIKISSHLRIKISTVCERLQQTIESLDSKMNGEIFILIKSMLKY